MTTFACNPDALWERRVPCCTCREDCDQDGNPEGCDTDCRWCHFGCAFPPGDEVETVDSRCCLEQDHGHEPSPLDPLSMPFGWPRPMAGHLPVPYIARSCTELGNVDGERRQWCVSDRRCQVCGEPLGQMAVVCARPGDVVVTDGAAVHPEPCWGEARRLCPELVRLARRGDLLVWTVATADLTVRGAGIAGAIGGLHGGYAVPTDHPDITPPPTPETRAESDYTARRARP